VETAINNLLEKITFTDHHLEHELTNIADALQNINGKMDKAIAGPSEEQIRETVNKVINCFKCTY
jgi:hypothetical protein